MRDAWTARWLDALLGSGGSIVWQVRADRQAPIARTNLAPGRDDVLHGRIPCASDGERQVRLDATDEAWSDYLAAFAELRAGSPWQSLGGQDPLRLFAGEAHAMFARMRASLDQDVRARLAAPAAGTSGGRQRGATWTYLTTDEPFGPMTERVMRGLVRLFRRR